MAMLLALLLFGMAAAGASVDDEPWRLVPRRDGGRMKDVDKFVEETADMVNDRQGTRSGQCVYIVDR